MNPFAPSKCAQTRARVLMFLFTLCLASAGQIAAQTPLTPPSSPQLAEGAGIIKSKQWAVALGKALFWDQQAGSDGNACASCHFVAGADTRLTNQLNPGFNDITLGPNGDKKFGSTRSDTGTVLPGQMPSKNWADSNYTLTPQDFPLHQLADETNRNSPIMTTTNDRISSQGAFDQIFNSVRALGLPDACGNLNSGTFHAGINAARQVEPRNTPTVINAAFNHRNFWDGRANNLFNGVGPFGMRDIQGDPNKRLAILDSTNQLQLGYLSIENASLASQAAGPTTSAVEMSCNGRSFADVGRKMLLTIPLLRQQVDKTDSVLSGLRSPLGFGLASKYSYAYMIQQAFDPKYWSAAGRYQIVDGALTKDKNGYTQTELNFSMFWGLAIMMYEQTLISNQSEYDALVANGSLVIGGTAGCTAAADVDPLLAHGCQLFFTNSRRGGGGCSTCHGAPLFSEAQFQSGQVFVPFLQAGSVSGALGTHDLGFINIGLRPMVSDQMGGRTDPYGNPLSYLRQYKAYQDGKSAALLDPFLQNNLALPVRSFAGQPVAFNSAATEYEVDGATKVPSLRNIGLTPPYFSWGGYQDLRHVMKVYNRGMNRRDITATNGFADAYGSTCTSGDDTGSGIDGMQTYPNLGTNCGSNVTGALTKLSLLDCDPNGQVVQACVDAGKDTTNDDLAAVVRFMESLSDPRVQCDAAPFDHPSLVVNDGHSNTLGLFGYAIDNLSVFPATGAAGYSSSSGYCIPNAGDLFAPGMQARSGRLKVPLQ